MRNLVKKFRVEVGFLPPPPSVTGTQIYPAEDRVKTELEHNQ